MTGVVLVLAGLTCADGGPTMGAALEPVAVDPAACDWEGDWKGCPVRVRKGLLTIRHPQLGHLFLEIVFLPDGFVSCNEPKDGRYALKDGWLVIWLYGETFVLRRAAQRKP
jgi:hypothetical protein